MDPTRSRQRRLAQNFIVDPRMVGRILDAFGARPGEPVVEIGAGRGALTVPLAELGVRLAALEIDADLAVALERRLGGHTGVRVVCGDALRVDLDGLARLASGGEERIRLLANLPYNIATAIVRRLLVASLFSEAQVLVQDEVADRLAAGPGEEGYGPLAVLCRLRGGARRLFRVGPSAFRPRPRVVSAAVRLDFSETAELSREGVAGLERLLRQAFAARRKTLVNNLVRAGLDREPVLRVLDELGLRRDERPEKVAPALWLALRDCLAAEGGPGPSRR